VNRRIFLKIGALGTSISAIPTVTAETNGKREIIVTKSGTKPKETRLVDKKWYNHVNKAKKAKQKVVNNFQERDDIVSASISLGDDKIGGLRSHAISVGVTQKRSSVTLEEMDQIPIKVDQKPRPVSTAYKKDYDPMKGGIVCSPTDSCDVKGGTGSICCRVWDKRNGSWNKYVLTARHLFLYDWCGNDGREGAAWGQTDTKCGQTDGHVVDDYQGHDAALLNLDSTSTDITHSPGIVSEDGEINCRVTGDGLSYLCSSSEIIQKEALTQA